MKMYKMMGAAVLTSAIVLTGCGEEEAATESSPQAPAVEQPAEASSVETLKQKAGETLDAAGDVVSDAETTARDTAADVGEKAAEMSEQVQQDAAKAYEQAEEGARKLSEEAAEAAAQLEQQAQEKMEDLQSNPEQKGEADSAQ